MRIFFTGGSGKAGRHVAPYLAEQGHHVTNADLVSLGHPAVADLRVDLTDAGETYSALAGLATFDELDLPEKPTYDAVVHFAAVPRIRLTSDAAIRDEHSQRLQRA
jgi:nucleoside-diphosphate-sugar epimerase